MNKNELVSAVAEAAKLSKGDAQSAVDAVFSVITGELKNGGDVRLVGFGNFSVSKRAESTGRNLPRSRSKNPAVTRRGFSLLPVVTEPGCRCGSPRLLDCLPEGGRGRRRRSLKACRDLSDSRHAL
jgi:nucleoid DNA-binding protein